MRLHVFLLMPKQKDADQLPRYCTVFYFKDGTIPLLIHTYASFPTFFLWGRIWLHLHLFLFNTYILLHMIERVVSLRKTHFTHYILLFYNPKIIVANNKTEILLTGMVNHKTNNFSHLTFFCDEPLDALFSEEIENQHMSCGIRKPTICICKKTKQNKTKTQISFAVTV